MCNAFLEAPKPMLGFFGTVPCAASGALMRALLLVASIMLTVGSKALAQNQPREFDPLPGGGQVYTVDVAHSLMDFTVRLAGFNRVRGSFTDWWADLFYDPAAPGSSSVSFVADVASIATSNSERDTDLRRPDFFDVEHFPRMRFRSTRVSPTDGGFLVEGTLTIRDSSRTVRFPATILEPRAVDPFGNWRLSFGATLTLNRRDFGVVGPRFWNNAISDSVTIEMEIAGRQWDYFQLGWGPQSRKSVGELLFSAADSGRLTAGLGRATAITANGVDSTINASAFEFEKAGMRRAQQGRLDDARRILEFGVETLRAGDPSELSEVLARLGEVLLRMGRRTDAVKTLRDAVAADPDNTLAQQLLVRAAS